MNNTTNILKYRDRPLSGRHTLRWTNGKDDVETRIILTSAIIEALDVQKKRIYYCTGTYIERDIHYLLCTQRPHR